MLAQGESGKVFGVIEHDEYKHAMQIYFTYGRRML